VTKDLPPENELDRWLGEPIKVGILSTDIFLLNKKGMHTDHIHTLYI